MVHESLAIVLDVLGHSWSYRLHRSFGRNEATPCLGLAYVSAYASIREATRRGITVRTNLIIGFPHETRRDVFQTIRYGLTLAARGADEVTIDTRANPLTFNAVMGPARARALPHRLHAGQTT